MSDMIVHGGILTKDKQSMRLLYEKNGKFFVRSGWDKFSVGVPIPTDYKSMFTKYSFRSMDGNPPAFIDGEDMWDARNRFHLTQDGKIGYTPEK